MIFTARNLKEALAVNKNVGRTLVKLPCHHGSMQLENGKDQFVKCAVCAKKHYFYWTKKGPKL